MEQIEVLQLTPTLWSEFNHVNEVDPLSDKDYDVLKEIRGVLEKHNALNRFGVNLIHRHFDLNENEILFETTDEEDRKQSIDVQPSSLIKDRSRVLETQWVFNGAQPIVCPTWCPVKDGGHPNKHQKD